MDFRFLFFYRFGDIFGSVTGCCVPLLLTNLYVFNIRPLGEADCDSGDCLAVTNVRERLSVI